MKNNIIGLLLVASMIPFVLMGQDTCKHSAYIRMYFQTYEEMQIDGQLHVRLYCIAEEAGKFYLPQFSSQWNDNLQAIGNYAESVDMQIGDSLAFDYVLSYNIGQLPYYSVRIQVDASSCRCWCFSRRRHQQRQLQNRRFLYKMELQVASLI